jgi:hypothetical protein
VGGASATCNIVISPLRFFDKYNACLNALFEFSDPSTGTNILENIRYMICISGLLFVSGIYE